MKVHFLYGSRPFKKYKGVEPKWFGGILGGHVGIEGDSGRVVNFLPKGKFHWIASKKEKHGRFATHEVESFYSILGGDPDSVKMAIVYIPVSADQRSRFVRLTKSYLADTPYDYALFGMRCGAAAYDILGQLSILPAYSHAKTARKIFYPKKLRRRLFKMAEKNGWSIYRKEGSIRRKWEKD